MRAAQLQPNQFISALSAGANRAAGRCRFEQILRGVSGQANDDAGFRRCHAVLEPVWRQASSGVTNYGQVNSAVPHTSLQAGLPMGSSTLQVDVVGRSSSTHASTTVVPVPDLQVASPL